MVLSECVARENNLRNIDVDVPRDAIVAFSGVSGSGKSSLAFGTIFAEAQRRYFESVAPYAHRLIQQGHTPKVDQITGLPSSRTAPYPARRLTGHPRRASTGRWRS